MTDLKRSINTGHIWDWGHKMNNFTEKTPPLLCHSKRVGAFLTFGRVAGIWSGSNRWLEEIDSKKPSEMKDDALIVSAETPLRFEHH